MLFYNNACRSEQHTDKACEDGIWDAFHYQSDQRVSEQPTAITYPLIKF